MNKKKIANFNLNQSIKDFQVNITELLPLNNSAQWNGITLLEREKAIELTCMMVEKKSEKEWIENLANFNSRQRNS